MTWARKRFVDEFLGFLERREARQLSWGFYDTAFDVESVESAMLSEGSEDLIRAWQNLADEGESMVRLLDDMAHHRLLHQLGGDRYRTRFAETVRLIARLRQLFKPEDWNVGPRLVSDIQLHLAPRRFPRRDQIASECWFDIAQRLAGLVDTRRAVFDALASSVNADGEVRPLEFSGFQRRAFSHIAGQYGASGFASSVVSAGTGAGKTKAFYIPAFIGIAGDIGQDASPYTKVIAIYPRNVLLADQLREALRESAKVAPVLAERGLRTITFGALLGDTPREYFFSRIGNQYRVETFRNSRWERRSDGFAVPFLKSPVRPDEELIWRDVDRAAGRTTLYRAGQATPDVPDRTLLITREQLQRRPPDVLFVSLEMLNREMGNTDWSAAFGIGVSAAHRLRMLLLDEVHTYAGLQGAQAAWVLRRWIHWARASKSLHIVGLSATLRDAPRHLALVSGVSPSDVVEFRPVDSELLSEGMEYNLAVKGDASSAASLLSTSIQAAMLLARTQTPRQAPQPANDDPTIDGTAFYGRKVFAFSDNLDVLNRWMNDLSNAEAQRLARLRLPPEARQPPVAIAPALLQSMRLGGQIWDLPHRLKHDLHRSLNVTRCSSQDPGVDSSSEMVVATASLEVGYDDPDVGATLHHKAPRSLSSFIQRKGRAGRRRGVRPWTVVVLSDYGVDRWAFQQAEKLFQPEIEATSLPMSNPYILRIQATSFLVDWLGQRIRSGSPYDYLTKSGDRYLAERNKAISILRDFLAQGREWRRFRADFVQAFRWPNGRGADALPNNALDSILWEAPRPVLTQAVPALLRKLEGEWRISGEPTRREDVGANRPLPQFLPSATFADLDVAEARLTFAAALDKGDEYLSTGRMLFECCPGHVSKRYSTHQNEAGHWHALSQSLLTGRASASIAELFPNALFLDEIDGVDVYQPIEVCLDVRPAAVADTSKAAWEWRSRLRTVGNGRSLPVLSEPPWTTLISSCESFLHRDHCAIEVIRYTNACSYELKLVKNDPLSGRLAIKEMTAEGTTEQAVGFRQRVDGIVLRLLPHHTHVVDEATIARFRPEFFLDQLTTALQTQLQINPFLAEWLWHTSMASLTVTAALRRTTLQNAQGLLDGRRRQAAERVLDSIFAAATEDVASEPRLKIRILDAWADQQVAAIIHDTERVLWEPLSAEFHQWAQNRYVATVAQAFRSAVISRVGDLSEDDLAVDVTDLDGHRAIILSEIGSGGIGHIERIARELRQDPDRFHGALEDALTFCPRHRNAESLTAAIQDAVHGGPIAHAFAGVRDARSYDDVDQARIQLQDALAEIGLPSHRSAIVTVVTRLLRPGSSLATDRVIHLLNLGIRRLTQRLRVSVDARVFAYICVRMEGIRSRISMLMSRIGEGILPTDSQVHAVVQQLLFLDCEDSCPECLDHPNRYNRFGRPSKALVRQWLLEDIPAIIVDNDPVSWVDIARERLVADRRVYVHVSNEWLTSTTTTLQQLLADELDFGHLLVPITIVRADRLRNAWRFLLQLRGTLHA